MSLRTCGGSESGRLGQAAASDPGHGSESNMKKVLLWRLSLYSGRARHCRMATVPLPTREAAGGASRSRETSTPRAVRALQSLYPAVLAEGRTAQPHCVPPAARRDRARRARHVPSALFRHSPQPCWRGATPHGRTVCRRRRAAIARDERATCRQHFAAVGLPSRAGG